MIENTIELGGETYAVGTLPADKQFHLARRIGPILASLGITLEMLKQGSKSITPEMLMTGLGPVSHVLAAMDDEVVDYILANCLIVCKRAQVVGINTTWAPVTTSRAPTTPMFDDISMPIMIRLVIEVLMVNLLGFTLGRDVRQTSTPSTPTDATAGTAV